MNDYQRVAQSLHKAWRRGSVAASASVDLPPPERGPLARVAMAHYAEALTHQATLEAMAASDAEVAAIVSRGRTVVEGAIEALAENMHLCGVSANA